MSIPKNKAYAFWKYDLFPYILGGRVSEILKEKDTGKTYIKSSDFSNMSFYPVFFLDEKTGAGMVKEIEELRADKKEEQAFLDKKYVNKLNALFDEISEPYRVGQK